MSCPIVGRSKKKKGANQVYYYSLQEYPSRQGTPVAGQSTGNEQNTVEERKYAAKQEVSLLDGQALEPGKEDISEEELALQIKHGEIKVSY